MRTHRSNLTVDVTADAGAATNQLAHAAARLLELGKRAHEVDAWVDHPRRYRYYGRLAVVAVLGLVRGVR